MEINAIDNGFSLTDDQWDLIKEAGTEVEEGKVIDKIIEAEIKEEAEEEAFGDKTDTSQKDHWIKHENVMIRQSNGIRYSELGLTHLRNKINYGKDCWL